MSPNPAFKFIIVYEDRTAGIRAKEMADRLSSLLEFDCHISNEAWNFALLSDAQLRQVAAADARHADMVIVSAHSIKSLPQHVRSWLEEWMPESKAGKTALVVLLGDQNQAEEFPDFLMVRDDLRKLAVQSQVDFFCAHQPIPTPAGSNIINFPTAWPPLPCSDVI